MAKTLLDEAGKARCHALYEQLIGPLRAVAWWHGYALGVHGSLERDIDLIAAPWIDDCASQEVLAEAIRQEAERQVGAAFLKPLEAASRYCRMGCPGSRAHGRRVWSFHIGGGPYIDLSVMKPCGYEPALLDAHESSTEAASAPPGNGGGA